MISGLSKDKIKEYLDDFFNLGTYEINSFDYKEMKSSLPVINETLDITVNNYATVTGKRIFVTPNIMTKTGTKLPDDTSRKYDIETKLAYKDIDSVEIEIPKGYQAEAMPQDVSIETKFGKYNSAVRLKDDKLFYYRSLERYSGNYPAKEYNELVKFIETVYKADRNRVVLVKN